MKFARITNTEVRKAVDLSSIDIYAAQEEEDMYRKQFEAEAAMASVDIDWDEVDQVVDYADRELAALHLAEARRIRRVGSDPHRSRRALRRASHDVLRSLPSRLDLSDFANAEEEAA